MGLRVEGLGVRVWVRVREGQVVSVTGKVDVRLPGKGNSNSHGARPVHLIITMIKRIRTSRLSISYPWISMVRSWRSETLKVKATKISLSVSVPGTLGMCVLSRT